MEAFRRSCTTQPEAFYWPPPVAALHGQPLASSIPIALIPNISSLLCYLSAL